MLFTMAVVPRPSTTLGFDSASVVNPRAACTGSTLAWDPVTGSTLPKRLTLVPNSMTTEEGGREGGGEGAETEVKSTVNPQN